MADIRRPDDPAPPPPPPAIGRRLFLAGTAGAAALLATRRVPCAWATPGAWPDDPFALGVASGDPTPTGVVLWTRLAPRPLDPDGGMPARPVPVDWEVATGPRLRDVVARGRVAASPTLGHAVHVEVDGLDPGRYHWYRFRAGGHLSRVGRTRTCADPRAPLGRLALAVVSCQNYEKGWYTATRTRRAWTCPAVTPAASRPTWPATGSATPSTRPTPTCRRPTPAAPSSSPGTTTRSRTTTPAATRSRAATRQRSCAAGRPPTAPTGSSTCRCAGRPAGPPCPCTAGCGSATWSS